MDLPAGPSELLVVADDDADPKAARQNTVAARGIDFIAGSDVRILLQEVELKFGAIVAEGEAARAMVPSLLLQPLVENSIKHAIAANEAGGKIGLGAKIVERDLVLEVTDTGSGDATPPPLIGKGRGVGLENTLQRLKTLYNDAYAFDIQPRSRSGLRITIRIPFEAA